MVNGWSRRGNYGRGSWVPERINNAVLDYVAVPNSPTPSDPVVTVQEFKDKMKVTTNNEDDYILTLSKVCQSRIEIYCGISLTERTIKAVICNHNGNIELPLGPIISVTSITDGGTFDGSFEDSFSSGTDLTDQMILQGIGFKWLQAPRLDMINIQYQVGFTADTLPPDLKEAVLQEMAFRFQNRDQIPDSRNGVSPAICNESALYANPYRRNRFI